MIRHSLKLSLRVTVSLLFWSLVSNAALAQTISFMARRDVPVGINSQSVAAGDFDRDGLPDLAVANYGANTVSILLSNGDGSFETAQTLDTGLNPQSLAVGDFNGDGAQDLAVANNGSDTVSVLLGNGDGTFQAALTALAGTNPQSVAVADFNRDGMLDLAVANSGSNTVAVMLGNGNGTFRPLLIFGTGLNPQSVATGDLNGDGKPDLAVADYGSNSVSVLLGNGDGTFQMALTFGTGTNPQSVAAADFNGDGKLDLAAANFNSDSVSVLLGNGDGSFGAATSFAAGSGPFSVAVGDFDGDQVKDLAVADYRTNSVSVLLGNGNGTFQAARIFDAGTHPVSIGVGDFNGDLVQDLAIANRDSNTGSVLLGKGDGTFQAARSFAAGGGPVLAVAGDLNGDGKADLVVTDYDVGTFAVLLGNGDGTFRAPQITAVGAVPWGAALRDFDGDGRLDLAVANSGTNFISVLRGNGDGTFQAAVNYTVGSTPQAIAANDFNGDGKLDLVVANENSNTVSVLRGNGNGTFQAAQNFAAGNGPASIAAGDFNGDGKWDLALADFYGGTVAALLGNGDGTFQAPRIFAGGPGAFSIAAGDFNADGKQDLAVANYISNAVSTVSVLLGNGDGTFQSAQGYTLGRGPCYVVVADFNGDGKQDLAVPNYGSNANPVLWVSVLQGNGDGTFQTPRNFGAGSAPIAVAVLDLNGDAKLDMAVVNYGSNDVSVLFNNTVGQPVATPAFSLPGGTYVGSLTITISDATAGATIHYTLDGTTPTIGSPVYAGPIALTQTTTLKALAAATGMDNSQVASATYTLQVVTPTFSPPGGTYNGNRTITISDATGGATIYYTIDGTTPTTASPVYSSPITVKNTTTIKAMAAKSGMVNSAVASVTYTIKHQIETPTFNPAAGTYVGPLSVTISDATSGATIHYTTDGSTPTTSSPVYVSEISITRTTTIKAIAVADGMNDSNVATALYTIQVATPAFGAPGGTYNQPQTVTLSDATIGATIYYTTDGSTPTTASLVYSGGISVTQTTTIKAMATASGMVNSAVASATYVLQAATPTFSPPGGNYIAPQSVSISDASPGVTIYYTTDGSTPTTSSTTYTGPILVLSTTTIKAIAVAAGWSQSAVATATYTFGLLP